MKALSLWQPHAHAIALGLKPYETRDWSMKYRGPLAIHAAKRRWEDVGDWHAEARIRIVKGIAYAKQTVGPMAFGAVVCVVDVVDCIPTRHLRGVIPDWEEFWGDFSDGESGMGRFAFKLQNVRVLQEPFYVRGQQGLWELSIPGFEGVTAAPGNLNLFGGAK